MAEHMGIPDPSFTSHQLREARAEAISLAEKNDRLVQALSRARERLEELGNQLDAVTHPPLTLALVTAVACGQNAAAATIAVPRVHSPEDTDTAPADLPCHDDATVSVTDPSTPRHPRPDMVEVNVGGRPLWVGLHPRLNAEQIRVGHRVALNDAMLAIEVYPPPDTGDAVIVEEVFADRRVLATLGSGTTRLLRLADTLDPAEIGAGDTLAADLRAQVATAVVERSSVEQLVVAETPDVSWDDIGGLGAQIEHIRDALELPFAYPELYRSYGLRAPKGVLLYGPPGCGKTLIAKAVAASLASSLHRQASDVHGPTAQSSAAAQAAFLNIKGPELLSKFVGETERHIRAIFEQARTVAADNRPVVIFFDEMEALFRTRGTGISSDVETMIVPQVLAEIDGVESLRNVIIIGASNREDMIDPALLRPGRLDIKIRIDRPDAEGAYDILSKHLHADVPLDPLELAAAGGDRDATLDAMRRAVVDAVYFEGPARALTDTVSGAMLASIVSRAKTAAIKDHLAGGEGGISTARLLAAVVAEAAAHADISAQATRLHPGKDNA